MTVLKTLRSECEINLVIDTDGPLLIKSGQTFVRGPDMAPVRTIRNGRWEVFIPGSSLKGALRAHTERIVRTLSPHGTGCCDPFREAPDHNQTLPYSCSSRLERRRKALQSDALDAREIYRQACPVCKLFGCLSMAGRLAFNDAHEIESSISDAAQELARIAAKQSPEQLALRLTEWLKTIRRPGGENTVERSGVVIDRFTGGAADGALFQYEVVSAARFTTIVHLRNFELWQLGLLGFVLRDLENGIIKLGMGKSRGLGRITAQVTEVEIRYLGLDPIPPEGTPCQLRGIRLLEREPYGFSDAEQQPIALYDAGSPEDAVVARSDGYGLRTIYRFDEAQCDHLWRRVALLWVTYARRDRTRT